MDIVIRRIEAKIEDAEYRLSCMWKGVEPGAFEEIFFEIDELYGALVYWRQNVADIKVFDKMTRGEEISFDVLSEFNKARIEQICAWLMSCGYISQSYELRMLFIGAIFRISNGFKRSLI